MSLGQKLKLLLKENNMTQEDLAERLDVSRQAVGKWVNDKGLPEVDKLVQISNLFEVSLDYLLKEDYETKEVKNISNSGYYVSKETLNGYLLYNQQNIKRITCGISLFILSNVFESFGFHNIITDILYWLTMIAGVIIIVFQIFQVKQYDELKTEHLIFDDKVFEEYKKQREVRRKKYTIMIIIGVILLTGSLEAEQIIMIYFGDAASNIFEWIINAAWLALFIWAGMSMYADSVIIKNAKHVPKNSSPKRYRWIYGALPFTAIAVLIGIITNAWSPFAPIIILFCCLLVTTCKLIMESREKNE